MSVLSPKKDEKKEYRIGQVGQAMWATILHRNNKVLKKYTTGLLHSGCYLQQLHPQLEF